MYGKMLWKMRTFPNRGDIIHNMLEYVDIAGGERSMYGKMLWKMRTFPNRGDIIHNMLEYVDIAGEYV